MDKGNHYQKCDLQVHTPRDRGWKGGDEISDEDRERYANNFVKECREAGLNAVAITDHHDMAFFEYIKNAAKNELGSNGESIPEDLQLVVFPGIELTLHQPPIQGLLIFDADFPENLFQTVLGCLSIAPALKTESKTSETDPIPSGAISSINDLYSKLDGTDGVKGRYIFLPHIKNKGHKTLLRRGFHEAYAKMPCVGGYVDGKYKEDDEGCRKIINGEIEAYGFKSVAVIQTSDYRAEKTLKEIDISTWIKWREPTAEALRQACLAKESRISLVEPEVPNIYIEKIDVTNSVFLTKFNLDFNPQLNSIIGGRGSGKSTILEYLRWALCDQTETFGSDDEKSEIERKRNSLIEKTLKEVNGEVRIFFIVNGTRHVVKRNPKSEDVLLKVGDTGFQSVRPQQISDLLPIQAYSQKQLSSVSMRSDELKRFIEQPISEEVEELDIKILSAAQDVRSAYEKLSKSKFIRAEVKKNELEIDSYKKQIEKLRGGLKGISDDDKKIIERAKYYVNEKNRFDEVKLEYSTINENLNTLLGSIKKYQEQVTEEGIEYENKNILGSLDKERSKFLNKLFAKISDIREMHSMSRDEVYEIHKSWITVRDDFENKYLAAKERSSSSKTTLSAIKDLEEKIEKLEYILRQNRSHLSEIDATDEGFQEIYRQYVDFQSEKSDKLKKSTEFFTALSDGLIKADFEKTIDIEKLAAELKSIFSSYSLNIPSSKAEKLADLVSSAEKPIIKWYEGVFELKSLREFKFLPDIQNELPHTPILDLAGFTVANKRKISDSLSSEGLLTLAILELDFLPRFYYLTHNEMGDEIPFEDASAGQQATALLNVLLNQEGFPLIIDQPEDDIDNRAIDNIIRNVWQSKKKRQIIISSHNANIVVNGDSELVVVCDYNETSDQTKGHIKFEGSIDKKKIRNEITLVMEGGERAFKLRKEKYGF